MIAILSFSIAIIIIHPRKRKKWTYIDDILQVSLTLSITNALGHVFSVKLLNPLLNEVFHRNETFIIPTHFLLKAIVYVWVTGLVFYALLNFYSLTKLQFKNTLLNKNNNHNTKNLNSITFIGKNKNEHLSLRAKNLLYIKSLGHYIEIVYKNEFNAKIDSKTLRLSMNETEQLVELYPYIIRCHKSYFVNTIHVKNIISNASKYQAVVKHIAILIPISKEKITHIEKALSK
ncbi:LytTR family transcriptional regulator DNA-binding domain-containing protein [Tenacibaculum xiamenense]|uniref:LytTR family transcriptional regulator DNA-binding domain-containing protein n=1 Tax=Tenacibaculum xiamenense TaxID=1261553 RepID=UPI0038B44E72